MKASLEILAHFNCESCSKWWSIGDNVPRLGGVLHCPHCGFKNTVEAIVNGKGMQVEGVAWITPQKLRDNDKKMS